MALNKKTGSVLVLAIAIAALVYTFSMNDKGGSDDMPVINGDVANVEDSTPTDPHAGMTAEEHAHAHADHEDHAEVKSDNAPLSETLTGLNQPSPLTVHPALGIRAIGNPDAPVKVTEVFSLTCSHCATFHNTTYPLIKENFVDTGKVYYVYQEFPFNAPALHASMIARCLPQERYAGFIDILFKTQTQWVESADYKGALRQNAKLAGMSDDDFDACMENLGLQQALAGVINEASQKWSIKSTPSLVINDGERVISGAQPFKPVEYVLNQFLARAQENAPVSATEEEKVSFVAPEVLEEVKETAAEEAQEATQEAAPDTVEGTEKKVKSFSDIAKDIEGSVKALDEVSETDLENKAKDVVVTE